MCKPESNIAGRAPGERPTESRSRRPLRASQHVNKATSESQRVLGNTSLVARQSVACKQDTVDDISFLVEGTRAAPVFEAFFKNSVPCSRRSQTVEIGGSTNFLRHFSELGIGRDGYSLSEIIDIQGEA